MSEARKTEVKLALLEQHEYIDEVLVQISAQNNSRAASMLISIIAVLSAALADIDDDYKD